MDIKKSINMEGKTKDVKARNLANSTLIHGAPAPLLARELIRSQLHDQNTTARDILKAVGEHPVDPPLNAHLFGLGEFSSGGEIKRDYDLRNLDWNSVRFPMGPPHQLAPRGNSAVAHGHLPLSAPFYHGFQEIDGKIYQHQGPILQYIGPFQQSSVQSLSPESIERAKKIALKYRLEGMPVFLKPGAYETTLANAQRIITQHLELQRGIPPTSTTSAAGLSASRSPARQSNDRIPHHPHPASERGLKRKFQIEIAEPSSLGPILPSDTKTTTTTSNSTDYPWLYRPAQRAALSPPRVNMHSRPDGRPDPGFMNLGPHNSKSSRYKSNPPQNDGTSEQESDDPLSSTYLTPQQFYSQPATAGHFQKSGGSYLATYNPANLVNTTPRHDRPSKDAPQVSSSSRLFVEIPSSPHIKKFGKPFKNDSTHSKTSSSAPKKKGRPFKTAESAAKARAKVARAEARARGDFFQDEEIERKRGRPGKIRSHIEVSPPPAIYHSFLCEWKGCQAELMNMDTLRRHVNVVHGKKAGPRTWVCMWGKCGKPLEEDGKTVLGVSYSKKAWSDHIEEEHLEPFVWHMGDGPKGSSLERRDPNEVVASSLAYLSDASGMAVTPSVFSPPQTIEAGRAKDNNARRMKKMMRTINMDLEPPGTKKMFANVLLQTNSAIGASESEVSGIDEDVIEDDTDIVGMDEVEMEDEDDAKDEMNMDVDQLDSGVDEE